MRRIDPRSALVAAIAAALLALTPLSVAVAHAPSDDISGATLGLLPRAEDPTPGVEDEPATSPEPDPEPEATDPATEPASPEPTIIDTPTSTEEPTTSAPTSASAPASVAPDPSQSADADAGLSLPAGLPMLLGLGALLAAVVGAVGWLLAGSARKRRWDAALDVERLQAQWVAEELVPALTDEFAPTHELVGYWSAAQPTLDQLQTNLADLASQAPDDRRAASVAAMSTASAQVRSSAASLLSLAGGTGADPQAITRARAALLSASAQLTGASAPHR
ncbi:MAG: hypothetical protein WCF36_13930 [Candidatus Nanopelagicales bacterium]